MPTITHNAQSFAIDGRRIWIVGAGLEYGRIDPGVWKARIDDVARAGFNTVMASCPWSLHEPRKGRYHFEGNGDIQAFLGLCRDAGLWAALRVGPFVGAGYDGGGLPVWLGELEGVALREASRSFLERMARYLRKLVGEIAGLQVTDGGPLLLVQAEHGWCCSNQEHVEKYLDEVARIVRESGIAVPVISANDLWPDAGGTIETWRGRSDLLRDVRQLHAVQDQAPRIVSAFHAADMRCWGDGGSDPISPDTLQRQLAGVLAAGGQPIVCPFHGGSSFGFDGGQLPGAPGQALQSTPVPDAPLGVAGARTPSFHALRRLVRFAGSFGHVFADLDPQYQPVTLDPPEIVSSKKSDRAFSIIPLRGGQGRVIFVFAHGGERRATLLLDNGLRLPIDLGDQSAAWFLIDVDLHGRGRLDYTNCSPIAMIDRSIFLLQGAAKAPVFLSINGSPLQETVPSGRKPTVVSHQGLTIVICSHAQMDVTYDDGTAVFVGIDGFDDEGAPRSVSGYTQATVVAADGSVSSARPSGASAGRAAAGPALSEWEAAPATEQVNGTAPRYATLDGPQTLAASGAAAGYGWYRIELKSKSAAKRLIHAPQAADRVHLFLDGQPLHLFGVGPAADPGPAELKLAKGEQTLIALVDNLGRLSGGTDVALDRGLFGHLQEVKPMRSVKPKTESCEPVDPFVLRGFIDGQRRGQLGDAEQVVWSFTHARKTPILLDIVGAASSGTIVLNDEPIAYYPGARGNGLLRVLMQPGELEPFKRGKNVLRFAPDPHQDDPQADIIRHASLYECIDAITGAATWAFARWEPPAAGAYAAVAPSKVRSLRGTPCWWRSRFQTDDDPRPRWFDTTGLSKGQVFVNGRNLGRYFTAAATGHAVGPQQWLHLPAGWLSAKGANELLIFDEHGFDPGKTRLRRAEAEG